MQNHGRPWLTHRIGTSPLCTQREGFALRPPESRWQLLESRYFLGLPAHLSNVRSHFLFVLLPQPSPRSTPQHVWKRLLDVRYLGQKSSVWRWWLEGAWVPPGSVDTRWRISLAWYKWVCSHLVRSPAETWERRFGCVGLLQTSCCASRFCSLGPYCSFYKHWFFIYIFQEFSLRMG